MSYRRHNLSGCGEVELTDVTHRFTIENYQYAAPIGQKIQAQTNPAYEHTLVYRTDRVVMASLMPRPQQGIRAGLIYYCDDGDIVLANGGSISGGTPLADYVLDWPEGATRAYLNSYKGTMRIWKYIKR